MRAAAQLSLETGPGGGYKVSRRTEEAKKPVRRIAIKVEYDGADFHGWQLQADQRTVQGVLEKAALKTTTASARLHGASRTDAGVHALGQVAHFNTDSNLRVDEIVPALNYWLPRDVSVLAACGVPEGFHARFSARSKLYRYRVLPCRVRRPLRERFCLRLRGALDLPAMQECARLVVGRHEFASFASERSEGDNTVRTVLRSEWRGAEDELHYFIEADGFLYNMVRALVGTMLEAGRGKLPADGFERILRARDRRAAAATAPAHGLTLIEVKYGEEHNLFA